MVCSGEYTGASRNTVTLPVEIACFPWTPVESIPTCSPTSLETIRVRYTHAKTSRARLVVARRLLLPPAGDQGIQEYPQLEPNKSCDSRFGTLGYWISLLSSRLIYRQLAAAGDVARPSWERERSWVTVGDSNSLQRFPRACRNAFHGKRFCRDLEGQSTPTHHKFPI